MSNSKSRRVIAAIAVACMSVIESAHAIEIQYTFSQEGWLGGGEVTGNFIIDENHPTQTGLLGSEALISFQAHWSGNTYTQPFDWRPDNVSIVWAPQNHELVDMELGSVTTLGVIPFYSPFVGLIWDERLGHIDPPTGEEGRYRTGEGLVSSIEAVPDGGNTFMLLGLALPVLFLTKCRIRRAMPQSF